MREANDETISRASVFVDTFQGGLKESGDIVIPLENGTLTKEEIKADLFELCSNKKTGRKSEEEITSKSPSRSMSVVDNDVGRLAPNVTYLLGWKVPGPELSIRTTG